MHGSAGRRPNGSHQRDTHLHDRQARLHASFISNAALAPERFSRTSI